MWSSPVYFAINLLYGLGAVTTIPIRKRRIKSEDDTLRPPQRPRLAINTDIDIDIGGTMPRSATTTDSPPPSALSLFSPTLSSASEPSTPIEASTPALRWPAGMYTVDVVDGFLRMDSEKLAGMNRAARFVHVYQRLYKSSTYDDNVNRWKAASSKLQSRSLNAGRTKEGLWTMFRSRLNAELEGMDGNDNV
ncbi:hypothetical protein C8F04DRAFT_1203938 [Mycena alexandri]|uniref:Uncharacterized protein n=1 Tax=Mycena alexandri TaxID=1745969 RepID=A0AAD6RVH2_9AGAR|nr:hypothetical protein C8F04DRAFT_1203938 [Mycena alexandri]